MGKVCRQKPPPGHVAKLAGPIRKGDRIFKNGRWWPAYQVDRGVDASAYTAVVTRKGKA